MNRENILVLGVSGNVSIGIVKSIKNSDINAHIIGACVEKYAAGFALCDESLLCPYANHEDFLPWLNKVIEDNNISIVLSGVEEINKVLASAGFSNNNKCQFLTPEKYNLETFSDKLTTINWLAENNIGHPKTLDLRKEYSFKKIENSLSLPFILKPKSGKGSVNIHTITNEKQYLDIEDKEQYVAQELIGNAESEYTCGVYKSKFGYTEILVMRRILRNGSTIMAEVVDNKVIYDYCKQIADACNTTAPFNIQLRLCNKTNMPFCFEVNMRLSGTTAIRHGFGFKDCQVWIKEAIQNRNFQSDFNVKPAIAIRYEAEVFLTKESVHLLSRNRPMMMASK